MTEQTTLRLPTYTAPASFDLLYDSLLDHLFIPVYANGQAHVLMLSGAATTQGSSFVGSSSPSLMHLS